MSFTPSNMVLDSPRSELTGPHAITGSFHRLLRDEVRKQNPMLSSEEQSKLRGHYPLLLAPEHYPPELIERIYVNRRSPAVQAILKYTNPVVFDAGCGYGSESFLFASLGARVLAVDQSAGQIAIARKRQNYYEDFFGRKLDITFVVADLESYSLNGSQISLTWLASVLAAIQDQDAFLKRIHDATEQGGKIIITDMNLLNPLFLLKEWLRRREAAKLNPDFGKHSGFFQMFARKNRRGARFFSDGNGKAFDDVQFFRTSTLCKLLNRVGFVPEKPCFSGFLPPTLFKECLAFVEKDLSMIPVIRSLGYFYLVTGIKGYRDK